MHKRIRPHLPLAQTLKPPAPEVVPAPAAWPAAIRRTASPAKLWRQAHQTYIPVEQQWGPTDSPASARISQNKVVGIDLQSLPLLVAELRAGLLPSQRNIPAR
jgi:hypothetical protein